VEALVVWGRRSRDPEWLASRPGAFSKMYRTVGAMIPDRVSASARLLYGRRDGRFGLYPIGTVVSIVRSGLVICRIPIGVGNW